MAKKASETQPSHSTSASAEAHAKVSSAGGEAQISVRAGELEAHGSAVGPNTEAHLSVQEPTEQKQEAPSKAAQDKKVEQPSKTAPKKDDAPKPSKLEAIKEESRALRGSIGQVLGGDSDHFEEADKQLLKFHGTYQQEDRDARKQRRAEGLGKLHMFMVRCKIPGGRVTAEQYLALDKLADTHANGTLRITSRQGIQFHGVLKTDLKATIATINSTLLTTLGACGDVNRNVMACPAPIHDGLHEELQRVAGELAALFAPRSRAYHDVWLNGKSLTPSTNGTNGVEDEEPIYGKHYLPRKFKIGITLPEDNCIDIYSQDLGLLAIVEEGRIVGYNVLVGGGMGMTHGKANTFPHLGVPMAYVPANQVAFASEAVLKLFRDHGNRSDRKQARIKYVVHNWGVDRFREVLKGYLGGRLVLPREVKVSGFDTHLGWHEQGNGKHFYGLSVESGRIKDEGDFRLRTALRKIVEDFQPEIRLTAVQDILLCDLEQDAQTKIKRILRDHGVTVSEKVSHLRQLSMACPAIPTCGLAISESERALPSILDELEAELKKLSLSKEVISVRSTGCPNGCARPYQSDIGIVGRSGDKYLLLVGGATLGDRLNYPLKDLVPRGEIVPTLLPLLQQFKNNRKKKETFGDFCDRLGKEKALATIEG